MSEIQYKPKDIIFREGDAATDAFVLLSGEVEILKQADHGEIVLATLSGEGTVFGEMGLFEEEGIRSATARAKTDAVIADTITREEFHTMIGQCPERIMPIIMTIVDRLRASNQRLSEKEQATILLDSEIERITVKPASEAANFEEKEVMMARLPFSIGGFDAEGMSDKNPANQLNILCEGPPLRISRTHCQIEVFEGGLFINDLGSRYNTAVNGKMIGRGKGEYRAPLQMGDNEIQLGGAESPYKLIITCE